MAFCIKNKKLRRKLRQRFGSKAAARRSCARLNRLTKGRPYCVVSC